MFRLFCLLPAIILLHFGSPSGAIAAEPIRIAAIETLSSPPAVIGKWLPVQIVLYVAANLLLIALGLYLAGIRSPITRFEHLGASLSRRIQPFTRRFLPVDSVAKAYALGMLWGWLPCGLVNTVLFTALLSGSALNGAILMLAFGLGTLPILMAAAVLLQRSRSLLASRPARIVSGATVTAFGVYGVAHAASLGSQIRGGLICIE